MKKITEPTREDERKLHEVRTGEKSIVQWGKKKFSIGWMRPYTLEKITGLALDGKENEIPARTAALILLNGYFKINLFYGLLWRWLYHCVPSEVLTEIISEGKKKEASLTQDYWTWTQDYWTCIILATVMRDTKMNLTKEEAGRILQEQRGAKHGQ